MTVHVVVPMALGWEIVIGVLMVTFPGVDMEIPAVTFRVTTTLELATAAWTYWTLGALV
jgi:hypothetical protein